jgi:5-methylcytosine-specific restriction enzyme subunit McrC
MDRTTPQTVTLTERVSAECRLGADDAAFLLAEHRAHVQLTPAGRDGQYRVTPTGHVGTIVGPACRLVIRPKIPVKNLFHILDPLTPVPAAEDRAETETAADVLDFLAGRLARLLGARATAGLHRAYAEKTAAGPFLQGRLDVPAHLRGGGVRKDRFHCRYEEFTADVPCNRLAKATAELVLHSPLPGAEVRGALRQALAAFADVSPAPLTPEAFQAAAADRLTESYRPLLDLCRLLAEGLGPGKDAGPTRCPAFLLDMERVFEQYVTRGLVAASAGGGRSTVSVQPLIAVNRPAAGRPDIHMRPDVVVERGGRAVTVVDAKWKRGAGPPLVPEDIYQVLAYATALGARRAVLVYPGRRNRAWKYLLAQAPLRLDIRTLRVIGAREECQRSLAALGRSLVAG